MVQWRIFYHFVFFFVCLINLLALFCLLVKNIVENDSFRGYFIVSTFYTLIYKLCNFLFLIRMPVRPTYLIYPLIWNTFLALYIPLHLPCVPKASPARTLLARVSNNTFPFFFPFNQNTNAKRVRVNREAREYNDNNNKNKNKRAFSKGYATSSVCRGRVAENFTFFASEQPSSNLTRVS